VIRPTTRPGAGRTEELLLAIILTAAGAIVAAGTLLWLAATLACLLTHGHGAHLPVSDGPRLLLDTLTHPAAPTADLPGATPVPIPLYYLTAVLLFAAATVAGIVTAVRVARWRADAPTRERDRSRVWARPHQLRPLLVRTPLPPHRVLLGALGTRPVAAEARRSVLVVAPTQAGKTTRYVIPTAARWRGPMLITTVKTDVLAATYRTRRHVTRGKTYVFDPTGSLANTPEVTCARWSPLLTCRTYPDAELTARWLIQAAADHRPDVNATFWETLAGKLLAPLLFAAARTEATMTTVAHWLDQRNNTEVRGILAQLRDRDAQDAWNASWTREQRQRDSVIATAESLLTAFTTPTVRTATTISPGVPIIDPETVLDENATVYLVAASHDQDRLSPLFAALVSAIIRAAQTRYATSGVPLDPPLMVMLDEAAHIAPLRELPTLAATGAGQGIQIVSVFQDHAQIEHRYGKRARSVLVNHTARVFLPGSADPKTLDDVSQLIGDHAARRESVSIDNDGRTSKARTEHDQRAAPPDYLRTLPDGNAVVLYGRTPPMRLTTLPWYADPTLRDLPVLPLSPGTPPSPRRPQTGPLPIARATGPLSAQAVPPPTDQAEATVSTDEPSFSVLDELTADPNDPTLLRDRNGRRYLIQHTGDGTRIPVPLDLTDAERAEIDAARPLAEAYRATLAPAAGGEQLALDLPHPANGHIAGNVVHLADWRQAADEQGGSG